MTLGPRKLVHRGQVVAAGLVLNTDHIGLARARLRVLAVWESGAELFEQADHRWVLVWAEPRRVDASQCLGSPLVRMPGGGLSEPPLSGGEILHVGTREVVTVRDSVAVVEPLGTPVDPASWLAFPRDVRVTETGTLGQPPTPPSLVIESRSTPVEALLGSEVTLAEQRTGVTEALASLRGRQAAGDQGQTPRAAPRPGRAWLWLRNLAMGRSKSDDGSHGSRLDAAEAFASGGSMWRRMSRWVKQQALGVFMGRKNTRYLRDMMKMFESGELDEALRHAVPLGGESDGSRRAAGAFGARDSLRVSRGGSGGGATSFSAELYDFLQRRYEAALATLKREQRWAEAAFVLAELLNRPEEAAVLLEEQGLFREAAELAETRELDPELLVRLWLQAGDVTRALMLARRYGVFFGLLQWLEGHGDPRAASIRWVYARHLIGQGALAAAIDAAWPLEARRVTVLGWVEQGIAAGGALCAQVLPKLVEHAPERFRQFAPAIQALLRAPGFEGGRARAILAFGLSDQSRAVPALRRPLARALLRDDTPHARSAVDRLVTDELEGVRDLVADMTSLARPANRPLSQGTEVLVFSLQESSGATAVLDAYSLREGRVLVALGESGAQLVDAQGRVIQRWAAAAERLIMAESETLAIAVVARGGAYKLTELDLVGGGSRDLGLHQVRGFASTWDGARLFAWRANEVLLLDTHSEALDALWRVGDLDGPVERLVVGQGALAFIVDGDDGEEYWRYDTSNLRLQERREVVAGDSDEAVDAAEPGCDGECFVQQTETLWGLARRHGAWELRPQQTLLLEPGAQLSTPRLTEVWLAAKISDGQGPHTMRLFDTAKLTCRVEVIPAQGGGFRLQPNRFVCFDGGGRVLALSLEDGEVIADFGVRT